MATFWWWCLYFLLFRIRRETWELRCCFRRKIMRANEDHLGLKTTRWQIQSGGKVEKVSRRRTKFTKFALLMKRGESSSTIAHQWIGLGAKRRLPFFCCSQHMCSYSKYFRGTIQKVFRTTRHKRRQKCTVHHLSRGLHSPPKLNKNEPLWEWPKMQ